MSRESRPEYHPGHPTEAPLDGTGRNPNEAKLLHLLTKGAREYAMIVMSPQHRILYWNKGAEEIFEYTEKEAIGMDADKLFTDEDIALSVPEKERAKAQEKGWAEDERWHRKKNQSQFWADGVMTVMRDGSGRIMGYSKLIREQTLRKQTEDRLLSTNAELTHFVYSAAHDLIEPAKAIKGYLGLIHKRYAEKLDPQVVEFITHALSSTKRLQDLITELRTFTELDRPRDQKEPTESSTVVDTAISNLHTLIKEKRAVVTRSPLPVVKAIPPLLLQLFQNLIVNGIKYHRPGEQPRVCVDVTTEGKELIFSVQDNGIGIAPENQEKIFLPFQRLRPASEIPGTGLGLFLCRRIVEKHGGRLWVKSEPGNGSTFYFSLPLE